LIIHHKTDSFRYAIRLQKNSYQQSLPGMRKSFKQKNLLTITLTAMMSKRKTKDYIGDTKAYSAMTNKKTANQLQANQLL